MTIRRVVSGTVHTQLITTTSIIAKLAVCAILLAGVTSAHAVIDDGSDQSDVSRRADAQATQNLAAAKPRPIRNVSDSNLSKLEREWKKQRAHHQLDALRRLVACRELGQCEGLQLHPTRGAALIRVSPVAVAAAPHVDQKPVSAARGVYAAAKAKKPIASAHARGKQLKPTVRIRSAAVRPVATDPGTMNPPAYGGDEHRGWTFGGFPSANP